MINHECDACDQCKTMIRISRSLGDIAWDNEQRYEAKVKDLYKHIHELNEKINSNQRKESQ